MDRWCFLTFGPKGVCQHGTDHGGVGKVIAINRQAVVVKWPGHMAWGGLGQVRRYVPARTRVYAILEVQDVEDRTFKVQEIVDWENLQGGPIVHDEEITKLAERLSKGEV